jgi:hypothetical protein
MNEHKGQKSMWTAGHTPGPWRVAGQGNGKQELPILGPEGEIACIRGKAHLADAHLIAAAPEFDLCLADAAAGKAIAKATNA